MKKIVLLIEDVKTSKEAALWLSELEEDVLVEELHNLDEFKKRYLSPEAAAEHAQAIAGGAPPEPSPLEEGEEGVDTLGEFSRRHLPIHLLVVDLKLISGDAVEWLTTTKEEVRINGYSKPEQPMLCMAIGYEGGEFDVNDFRHNVVDDLMLMPLDKSLFLQKAELHIASGESVQASFLFKQKAELVIEMGKDAWIEAVSDYGLAIRNPAPLANGVLAKIYSRLFGDGQSAGLIGRVYRVDRHPSEPGNYICFLTFYGITQTQLSNVRRFIAQSLLPVAKPSGAEWPVVQIPKKTVIVIDMNNETRDLVRDSLGENFQNVQVRGFPSYGSFLKFCARRMPGGEAAPPVQQSATPEASKVEGPRLNFGGASEISLLVEAETGELVSMEPAPKAKAILLGVPVADLTDRKRAWLDWFDADDKEEIEEFLAYLASGQSGQIGVIGRPKIPAGAEVHLRLRGKFERGDTSKIVRLTFRELAEDEWQQASGRYEVKSAADDLGMIDALYIDGSLLGETPGTAIEGVVELLRKAKLVESREGPAITVLGDEKSRVRVTDFRVKGINDFLYKPLDRKLVIEKATLGLRGLIARRDSLDLIHRPVNRVGRITKEVSMEEISEFGLQIQHDTPLKEKTFLRFFSSVFLDEKGEGILGRCLYSTRDAESGRFHCFFTFFGVTDAQLKHIRKWIRGDYASKKEKAGG